MALDDTAVPEILDTERATRTILVVEDDRDIRETLATMLERCGYRVIAAANGQEALDGVAADGTRPALIVLDWMMPVMGGLEFLERHDQTELLQEVPVLVLSAVDRVFNLSGGGIAATMTKPVRMRTLIDVIDRLCGLPRRAVEFLSGKISTGVPVPSADTGDDEQRTARTRAQTIAIRRPAR